MPVETVDLGTAFLRLGCEGHLARCTIDRPGSRNALSPAMYYGIKRAVEWVNARREPTALLRTGVGDVLSPGGELRVVREDLNLVVDQLAAQDVTPSRRCATARCLRRPHLLRRKRDILRL